MTQEQQRVFQQLSAEQQIVSSNLELIRQRMDLTQAFIRDQRIGLKTLEELKNRRSDEEILLSIGGGLLVKAKLVETDKVIRDAGSGVRIEATVDQAIESTKELIDRLEKQYQKLSADLEQLSAHAANLDTQLRDLLSQVQSRK